VSHYHPQRFSIDAVECYGTVELTLCSTTSLLGGASFLGQETTCVFADALSCGITAANCHLQLTGGPKKQAWVVILPGVGAVKMSKEGQTATAQCEM